MDQSIEEGKIDLLFEEEGTCVLVDYKTDTQVAGTAKYTEQVLSYVKALQSVGVRIGSAHVLWARTGSTTEIPFPPDTTMAHSPHS
jgi:hypothetical protein